MDFKQLDKESKFANRETLQKNIEDLDFDYISEAIVTLYKDLQSTRKVGKLVGLDKGSVLYWLRKWGVDIRSIKNSVEPGFPGIIFNCFISGSKGQG